MCNFVFVEIENTDGKKPIKQGVFAYGQSVFFGYEPKGQGFESLQARH